MESSSIVRVRVDTAFVVFVFDVAFGFDLAFDLACFDDEEEGAMMVVMMMMMTIPEIMVVSK